MRQRPLPISCDRHWQFRLIELLEVTGCCAVVAGCARALGLPATVFLAFFALALAARIGWLALGLFAAALVAAEYPWLPLDQVGRQGYATATVILLVASLVAWYAIRRNGQSWRFPGPSGPLTPKPLEQP